MDWVTYYFFLSLRKSLWWFNRKNNLIRYLILYCTELSEGCNVNCIISTILFKTTMQAFNSFFPPWTLIHFCLSPNKLCVPSTESLVNTNESLYYKCLSSRPLSQHQNCIQCHLTNAFRLYVCNVTNIAL
jgi:hypothetical protein